MCVMASSPIGFHRRTLDAEEARLHGSVELASAIASTRSEGDRAAIAASPPLRCGLRQNLLTFAALVASPADELSSPLLSTVDDFADSIRPGQGHTAGIPHYVSAAAYACRLL